MRWRMRAAVLALAMAGSAADAAVIDFSGAPLGQFTTLDVGAYRFTAGYDDLPGVFADGKGGRVLGDSDNGNFPGTGFTIARIDGALFTLDAVTLAAGDNGFGIESVSNGNDYQVLYDFDDGDRVTFDQFRNVSSLVLTSRNLGATTGFRTLELSSAADAVPEPATWGLMLTGFALVGGSLRRRRGTAARTEPAAS